MQWTQKLRDNLFQYGISNTDTWIIHHKNPIVVFTYHLHNVQTNQVIVYVVDYSGYLCENTTFQGVSSSYLPYSIGIVVYPLPYNYYLAKMCKQVFYFVPENVDIDYKNGINISQIIRGDIIDGETVNFIRNRTTEQSATL